MQQKYFQIGFNKCGTSSIARFFSHNGIRCVDWDRGRLARRMKENLNSGRNILDGYSHYDAFTDMESVTNREVVEGYKYFPQILDQIPHSMFILNTRDVDRWIRSRLNHGPYAANYMTALNIENLSELVAYWREEWDAHHKAVIKHIPPERLLVFNIEADDPSQLCKFVGLESRAAKHFRVHNITLSRFGRVIEKLTPDWLKAVMPASVKVVVRKVLRKRSVGQE